MDSIDMNNKFMLKNSSAPLVITLDVTSACNFRSLHCFNDREEKADAELTDDELYEVAKQVVELRPIEVYLCGGETMLRKNLIDIVKCISKECPVVNMVSNGLLFNEENISKLKEANINTIQISLDGLNAMQHDNFRGYPGAFGKVVNSIKLIKKAGINVVVSCTLNKLNYNTIDKYLDFALGLGVSQVRFMPLMPIGRKSKLDSLLLSPEEYLRLQLILKTRKDKMKFTNQKVEWTDPLDYFVTMPSKALLGYNTYAMEIKSNGDLIVSTYIPLIVGNVRQKTLRDYWETGYNTIWANKTVLDYIGKIETTYDVKELGTGPYLNEKTYIDITK